MPLPSFSLIANLYDIMGDVAASELIETALGLDSTAKIILTSNVPSNMFVIWSGHMERVRPVIASVGLSGQLQRNGETVRLLANDSGLNVTGIQWTAEIPGMAPITFNAPVDGATLNLKDVTPIPGLPITGVMTPPGDGTGDMLKAIYDPQSKEADAFARANHTGTQLAATISDFDAEADSRVLARMITDILLHNNDTTIPTSAAVKTLVTNMIAGIVAGTAPNYVQPVGDGINTDLTVTHNLGTRFVGLQVQRNSSPFDNLLTPPFDAADLNTIIIHNGEVWDPNEFTAIVSLLAQSDTTAPNPGSLAFSSSTSSTLTYTFSGASDSSGISHIDAYDATTSTLLQANVTSPYTRTGLLSSTSYATFLKVFDNQGNTANTNTITHSTDAPTGDTTPPTPGTLSFSSKTDAQIMYTFTAGSDNVAVVGVDAYDSSTNTLIAANVTSPWTRTGLTGSTAYGTYMRYRDAAGNHADSNTVTQTTNAPAGSSISFIDSHAEKTTTSLTTMPSHQSGDLLVMVAYRDGFNTAPSVPSGWTNKGNDGLNNNSIRIGTKVAASSSEVSGTWTNCTNLVCFVYRGAVSVGAVVFNHGIGSAITIGGLTLQTTNGSSWVGAAVGDRQGGMTGVGTATGMTARASYIGTSSTQDLAGHDTNGGVSSFTGSGCTATGLTIGWETVAFEIKTT